MRTAKQFTVPLANKPGRFSAVLDALTKEKVRTDAFSVMDSGNRGVLRFVPDDADRASEALKAINVEFEATDVLLIEMNGQAGGLPRICQRLADEHLNIDYSYGSESGRGAKGGGMAVIRVNNLVKAQKVLAEAAGAGLQKPKKRSVRRPIHTL